MPACAPPRGRTDRKGRTDGYTIDRRPAWWPIRTETNRHGDRGHRPSPTHELIGRDLRDSGSQTVGKITAVYQYPTDMHAPWGAAAVTHGLIRKATHLVDLEESILDGDAVQVPHSSHTINTAPNYPPLIGDTLADHHALDVRAHYWGAAQPA